MKKTKEKHSVGAGVILSLLGIVLVVVVIVILATGQGGISFAGIARSFTYRNLGSSQLAEEYDFEERSSAVYAALGDGLLIASKDGYEYIDKSGETAQSAFFAMDRPAIDTEGDTAVIYDVGGTAVSVVNKTGLLYTLENDKTVISAKVNASGWSAICTSETGTKGAATVYNSDGTAVYQRRLSEGYLVTAVVSSDGKDLSLLSLTERGSRIQCFTRSSEDIQAEYNEAGVVYNDIGYTSAKNIAAVSDERMVFLNQSLEELGAYDYEGATLKAYIFGEDSLLYLGPYQGAEGGTLILLNVNGGVSGQQEMAGEITSLTRAGSYTAALTSGQLTIYEGAFKSLAETVASGNVQRALVRDDGTALLISGNHVKLFVP